MFYFTFVCFLCVCARVFWDWMSRKRLEIEAWFQWTTNRKWRMANRKVAWSMTSWMHGLERKTTWPNSDWLRNYHRRKRRGAEGEGTCPQIRENIFRTISCKFLAFFRANDRAKFGKFCQFFGQISCKIRAFCFIFSGKNVLPSPKLISYAYGNYELGLAQKTTTTTKMMILIMAIYASRGGSLLSLSPHCQVLPGYIRLRLRRHGGKMQFHSSGWFLRQRVLSRRQTTTGNL